MEKEKLQIYRHSVSHIMADAVKKIYKKAKLAIGPATEDGFYYDFDLPDFLTPQDLPKIEEEMKRIIQENLPFEKIVLKKEEAKKFFKERDEIYKIELLEEIQDEEVTIYKHGEFYDLCKGPHINSTGEVKAFKLLSVAGAYWRGDERNKMLQRIYGTAFFTQEELDKYLKKLQEAEKRDHRKIGKELGLFSIEEEIGGGLILWHPKGAIIRRIIENFWIEEHLKRGYQIVYTPHIAKNRLWEKSGHLSFYKENMFEGINVEGAEYLVKPMNCPYHILIYKSKLRSYRELPIRYAELGTVYRYEKSGVLHGLLRVRGFTQDDAHIFCTFEQLKKEIFDCVELADYMMKVFGFKEYEVNLATRPEDKYAGDIKKWEQAENILKMGLEEKNIDYKIDEGGAAFYGPKIDIKVKDAIGRLWQGPTIQFDFNLPERFDVTYVGEDGKHHLVYMVHRAVLGSFERFFGCLIEHYEGAFPLWLSPVQVRILPITERNVFYAEKIGKELKFENLRVEVDKRNEKINLKIREAQLEKIPYMLIVGDREEKDEKISVRKRGKGDIGSMKLQDFKEILRKEIEEKI
jgi:threonyl-tRNA synthetase